MTQPSDAVRGLKSWQRDRARAQDTAMRRLVRARERLDTLDAQRCTTEQERDRAVAELVSAGLGLDEVAELLGVPADELASPSRRPRARDAERAGTAREPVGPTDRARGADDGATPGADRRPQAAG